MNELIKVANQNGKLVVSSREVATNFDKNHQHVLRDVDDLREGVQKWTDLVSPARVWEVLGVPNFGETPCRFSRARVGSMHKKMCRIFDRWFLPFSVRSHCVRIACLYLDTSMIQH